MFDSQAKMLRDVFFLLSLVMFAIGVFDILLLAMDMSLGTGLMSMMGFRPGTFLGVAAYMAMLSAAAGIIEIGRKS